MYDAPQCKVLIAGQSYMKCMELKRMLNLSLIHIWAWRERHGALLQQLAQRSETVIRIFCGLPQQLKP